MESEKITFELNPPVLKSLTDLFDMEIEVLQGEKKDLPNGQMSITVELAGEKLAMFKDFFKMLMSVKSTEIKVTVLGHNVNPN